MVIEGFVVSGQEPQPGEEISRFLRTNNPNVEGRYIATVKTVQVQYRKSPAEPELIQTATHIRQYYLLQGWREVRVTLYGQNWAIRVEVKD